VFFVKYRENQAYFWDLATEFANLGFLFVNLFDACNTSQARLYTANAIWVSPRLALELGYLQEDITWRFGGAFARVS
jgi:hypothetical protein